MPGEFLHIENKEKLTEQKLIEQVIENDREKLPKLGPDAIKAASLLACGKRFGPEVGAEYVPKLFPRE
ncbi:MAG: hypothetical protein ACP5IX_00830 [Patescibacteria group bacterium]